MRIAFLAGDLASAAGWRCFVARRAADSRGAFGRLSAKAPRRAGQTQTLSDLAAIVMDELEVRLAAMQEVRREREHRERALVQQRLAEQLARTLQRSLSPPRLPDLPGLQVAAHYQPFSEDLVGGDFYDLFSLGDGRWGVFLGDVCGKGPEAASLTSLARYTLRAAAMHREGPAAILRALNTALMDDTVQMAMCSAVYGEIDN